MNLTQVSLQKHAYSIGQVVICKPSWFDDVAKYEPDKYIGEYTFKAVIIGLMYGSKDDARRYGYILDHEAVILTTKPSYQVLYQSITNDFTGKHYNPKGKTMQDIIAECDIFEVC